MKKLLTLNKTKPKSTRLEMFSYEFYLSTDYNKKREREREEFLIFNFFKKKFALHFYNQIKISLQF